MPATKLATCDEENAKACPCVGGTLDKLVQPAILAVLAEGPIHGYRLAERLGAMPGFSGQKPDTSGIYRHLKAMEGRGIVAFAWNAPAAGPAKRVYQITPAGKQCLRRWIKTLETYRRGISGLLSAARKADHNRPRKTRCDE
jgi:DNA-binding PadR family transcriptional regulator